MADLMAIGDKGMDSSDGENPIITIPSNIPTTPNG